MFFSQQVKSRFLSLVVKGKLGNTSKVSKRYETVVYKIFFCFLCLYSQTGIYFIFLENVQIKKQKKKKLESLSIPNLDLSEKIGKVVTK